MNNKIILCLPDELHSRIEVEIGHDAVWLNRQQMAALFGRDIKVLLPTKIPSTDSAKASKQVSLDVRKASDQYGNFELKLFQ